MIGRLKGIIDHIGLDHVIIDVSGVGYVVYCSSQTLSQLPSQGEAAKLLIETHVREDHIHLYGFFTESEQEWFNILTTVKGVGTKMALAILSVLLPNNLIAAIGQMGIIVRLEEMHDIDTFLNYNLSGVPAMTINGQLAFEQQVPAIEDLMEQLGQHISPAH